MVEPPLRVALVHLRLLDSFVDVVAELLHGGAILRRHGRKLGLGVLDLGRGQGEFVLHLGDLLHLLLGQVLGGRRREFGLDLGGVGEILGPRRGRRLLRGEAVVVAGELLGREKGGVEAGHLAFAGRGTCVKGGYANSIFIEVVKTIRS